MKQAHQRTYISSIDGLRAVAVLFVLLFHADFHWAQGGYIGVDIFFVISGFLITRQITNGLTENSWSFSLFYRRRILRLFPALFATIILTQLAAVLILSASDLERLGRSSYAATFMVPNIFFWLEAGYFTQGATTKPLLHTWSLGVEEQFYLLWPAIIALSFKFRQQKALATIAALGVASFIASLIVSQSNPSAVFFLMPFRIFQFALGATLAVSHFSWKGGSAQYVGFGSIFCLCVLTTTLTDSMPILVNMLLPALLATLFIASSQATKVVSIFSSPVMQWMGKRSYAIYLAHWPTIVLFRMSGDFQLSFSEAVITLVGSVFLGNILYQFVETPLRMWHGNDAASVKRKLAVTLGLAIIATCLSTLFLNFSHILKPVAHDLTNAVDQANLEAIETTETLEERGSVCFLTREHSIDQYGIDRCNPSDPGKQKYLILGDSYAGDVVISLRHAYRHVNIGHYIVPGCWIEAPEKLSKAKNSHCKTFYKHAYETIIPKLDLDGVFLVSNWAEVSDKTIQEAVEYLKGQGLVVHVIGLRPRFAERIPNVVASASSIEDAALRAKTLESLTVRTRNNIMMQELASSISILNIYDFFCEDFCKITDENGALLFRDDRHLSVSGSAWLAIKIKQSHPALLGATPETPPPNPNDK